MQRDTSTARPNLANSSSLPCPDCGHAREGFATTRFEVWWRQMLGRNPAVPTCTAGERNAFADVDYCRCAHPAHSEELLGFGEDSVLNEITL